MAESWHSVVDEEIESVDEFIRNGVRSAYSELNEMCEATIDSSHHTVRPALCLLSYHANGGKSCEEAVALASCFEAVFDGLHMHDLVDQDGQVRGVEKMALAGNVSTTKIIVAGDFMYIMGFRQAYANAPKAVPYIMRAAASISDAIFDIVDNTHNPEVTEEACMGILKRKSAVEYQILLESAAKLAGAGEKFIEMMNDFGLYVGMAIQTVYDLRDLLGYGDSAPQMDTLFAGYPTVPLYHAMCDKSAGEDVRQAFSVKGLSKDAAEEVILKIRGTDVPAKCMGMVKEWLAKAAQIIAPLPDSVYKSSLIACLDSIGDSDA